MHSLWTRLTDDRPIWLYLGLFGLSIIIPALLCSTYLIYRYAGAERQVEHTQFLGEAALLASNLNREISNSLTTLRILAASPDLDESNFQSFHARASAALRGTGFFILLIDQSLQQLLNTRVPYGTRLGVTSDPQTAKAAFSDARAAVSDVFVGKVAQQPVFNVTLPVERDGRVIYVLMLTRDVAGLASFMNAQVSLSASLITLVDSQNHIIARSRDHNDFVTKPLPAAVAGRLHGYRGLLTADEADGSTWLIAHQLLPLADWRIVLAKPLAEVEANLSTSLGLLTWSGIALLALSLFSAFVFGRYMARPIRDLARQGRALGRRQPVRPLHSHLQEANEVSAVLAEASEERERHERHIMLLMRELRHRSKNQFAIIQALMKLTAKHSNDLDDFQTRFLPRVRSLSDSLELLDTKQWQGIRIADLVHTQMRSFDAAGRFRIEGPTIHVDSQAAQSLGLALHELATNAAKYGALSAPEGRVAIQWGTRGADDGSDEVFWMGWRESGGPAVRPPTRTGFGRIVVDQMVCHSTNGNVTLGFDSSGVTWTFECPTASLTEDRDSADETAEDPAIES